MSAIECIVKTNVLESFAIVSFPFSAEVPFGGPSSNGNAPLPFIPRRWRWSTKQINKYENDFYALEGRLCARSINTTQETIIIIEG